MDADRFDPYRVFFAAGANDATVTNGVDGATRCDSRVKAWMFARDDEIAAIVAIEICKELGNELMAAFAVDRLMCSPGQSKNRDPIDVRGVGDGVGDFAIARSHGI